jgi:hypothetical protein
MISSHTLEEETKAMYEPLKCKSGGYIDGEIDPEKFLAMVSERAYFKAQKRGFTTGHEWDDWFTAEKEVSNQCRYWSQE